MLAECVLPQISLLAEDILPRISQIYTELLAEDVLPQISQICTEVRLPSRGCTCLRSALPLARARSAPTKQNRYSPTESTEPTELLAEGILPQIAQIYTEVRLPSRGCTCLKCTNQARSAPTKQNRYSPTESTEPTELLAEYILPQIAQICTDCLGAFKGVHLSQVHQPSYVGAPHAMLVHLRQVHPLKLAASVSICEICGRLFSAEGSVNFAYSVGDP